MYGSARKVSDTSTVISVLVKKLKSIPDVSKLRADTEFLAFVCNLVENVYYHKSIKIDKKATVLQVLEQLFPGSTTAGSESLARIESTIEYIHSNKMINRVSSFKLFCKSLVPFLFRRNTSPSTSP
jgi:hypothetical protein